MNSERIVGSYNAVQRGAGKFTIPDLTEGIFIYSGYVANGEYVNRDFYPMIVLGDSPHPYEPYHSATRTIDLQGQELRSLPDGTKDELIVHRNGRVELMKMVGELVYDGSEEWLYYGGPQRWPEGGAKFQCSMSTDAFEPFLTGGNASLFTAWMCNTFSKYGDFNIALAVSPRFVIYKTITYISVNRSFASTPDEVASKFRISPMRVTAKLKEPQIIPLGTIDPIPSYYPTTILDANGTDITAHVLIVDDGDPQTHDLLSVIEQS